MRTLAVTLAIAFAVGSALAALFMMFASVFPYENLSADEMREDDWLALAAPFVFLLAVLTLALVVLHRPFLAALSFMAQAVIGLLVLRFALRELSDRSDGQLIAFALVVGFIGLCAVTASFGQRTSTRGTVGSRDGLSQPRQRAEARATAGSDSRSVRGDLPLAGRRWKHRAPSTRTAGAAVWFSAPV